MTKFIYDAATDFADAQVTFATTQTTMIGTGIEIQMTPHWTPNKPAHHFHARWVVYGFANAAALDSITFRLVVGDDSSFTNKATAATIVGTGLAGQRLQALVDFAGAQVLMGSNAIKYARVEVDLVKTSGAGGSVAYKSFLTKA